MPERICDDSEQIVINPDEPSAAKMPLLFNPEGLWASQGTDISDEDLATARAEMWGKFDREKPDGGERSETEDELNEEIANA